VVNPSKSVTIAMVGKYIDLKDSYLSHIEAFHHAGAELSAKVNLIWVEAEDIETNGADQYCERRRACSSRAGSGNAGAREDTGHPVRQAGRDTVPGRMLRFPACGHRVLPPQPRFEDANSSELNPKSLHKVVDLLPEQQGVEDMEGR